MEVQVSWLAVFLAAVSTMVVGSIWYTPKVFGKTWMKMTGVKMGTKQTASEMMVMFGGVFVASLITAFVLAHVTYLSNQFFDNSFLQDALTTGFWLWLGFTALRFYVHDTFENRPRKLTLLNAAHELVTIEVMALIIGLMEPFVCCA